MKPASELTPELRAFVEFVAKKGRELYRDLPWRRTYDPYAIWISEVMLQQTQVSRVDGRWQRWLERFPTVDALAAAAPSDVLEEWQGLGYNRRALSVHRAAQAISEAGGVFPQDPKELVKLPGIGPATAAGICAFAFNLHGVYLETNVRTVFLHELYPQAEGVPDSELVPLVELTCPASVADAVNADRADSAANVVDADGAANDAMAELTPRSWYYALLDYGAYLKENHSQPFAKVKKVTSSSHALRDLIGRSELSSCAFFSPIKTREERCLRRFTRSSARLRSMRGEKPLMSRLPLAYLKNLRRKAFVRKMMNTGCPKWL